LHRKQQLLLQTDWQNHKGFQMCHTYCVNAEVFI
jgi:hypothetical protein